MKMKLRNRLKEKEVTSDWLLYVKGSDYAAQTGFKSNAAKNERFYRGDQWHGVKANNLPTPVFNIFKRIIDYVIAYICSSPIKITYRTEEERVSEILNSEADYVWEENKMDVKLKKALLDAAITGDMCAHVYWDKSVVRANGIKGDFRTEIIDGAKVFFGDVTTNDVSRQPYIIIAGRCFTSELIAEAKALGLTKEEIEKILPDSEAELCKEGEADGSARTTYLIKYYRGEDGNIRFNKSTREVVLKSGVNTGLTRYPIAFANWTEKKGSYHGESFAKGIIPNQIFINKMFAMAMKSLMDTAFPKVVYDKTKVASWSNAVGAALPVNGDISGVAKYLEGAGIDPNAMALVDRAVKYTEECMGATDVLLGQSIRPDNAAAIAALGQNAAVPMEIIKQNLYNFTEDIALIWLDFLKTKFTAKKELLLSNEKGLARFDYKPSEIARAAVRVKIDVGPSSYFSELNSVAALSTLFNSGAITAVQYLERLPKGYVPAVNELISELSSNREEL